MQQQVLIHDKQYLTYGLIPWPRRVHVVGNDVSGIQFQPVKNGQLVQEVIFVPHAKVRKLRTTLRMGYVETKNPGDDKAESGPSEAAPVDPKEEQRSDGIYP